MRAEGLFLLFMKGVCLPVAVLVIAVLFSSVAASDEKFHSLLETDLEELLNYTIYSPTKTAIKLSDAPGAVSVVTYDQIRSSSAQTIPELLRMVPGMNVRWGPMVQTMDVRSFGSNPFTSKVLLLIDGIPYNSWNKGGFPQHPGFDFFNLNNIKHLEVIRGSGSALYGENAFNGVINIATLSGDEFDQTQATVTYGSRETKVASLTHGQATGEDSSLFLSIRGQESQIPTDLWMDDTRDNAKGYDLFLKYRWQDLTLSYYRMEDKYGGYSHLVGSNQLPPDAVFRSAKNIEQEVNIGALHYLKTAEDESWTLEANASYANRYGSHCAACHANPQDKHLGEPEDHGNQKFANVQYSFKAGDNHEFLLGSEFRKITSGGHSDEFEGHHHVGGDEPDNSVTDYSKYAVFAQDRISLLEDRFQVTLGVRYDAETDPSLFDSELFPRVALLYKLAPKWALRAGWNKAARYPSFTELYQGSWFLAAEHSEGVIPLAFFDSNEDLGPEYIESFEAGVEYQASSNLHLKLDAYRNQIEDSIAIAYPVIRFENHPADARIQGVELEARWQITPRMKVSANWSFQDSDADDGKYDSSGNPLELTYAPRHKVNLALSYKASDSWSWMLEGSCRDEYMAPSFWYTVNNDIDSNPHPLDGYCLVDLGATYRPDASWLGSRQPLTIRLEGRNLLDETPYETLTGFGGRRAGREFFVTFEYAWNL